MVYYLIVFGASLLIDTIPFIGPPAWIVMVFFQMRYGLNMWLVLLAGVTGSTIGRYLLTLYVPWLTAKVVTQQKDEDLAFLGQKLTGKGWRLQMVVFLYTLVPVPTTPLFMALGMSRVKVLRVMPSFLVGKFISDMYMVYTGKIAAENVGEIMNGLFTWKVLAATLACFIFLGAMLFIDWKTLLIQKKFRVSFRVWK
jgi:membrane protein DedA with SNARE-associated domain